MDLIKFIEGILNWPQVKENQKIMPRVVHQLITNVRGSYMKKKKTGREIICVFFKKLYAVEEYV